MVAVLMSQRLGFPMVWPVNQDFGLRFIKQSMTEA
jgi:hypothetical protein